MRGLARLGVVFSHLQLDTAHRRLPGRPGRRPVSARGPGPALRRAGAARPRRAAPGQLDLSGTGADAAGEAARRAAAVARLVEPLERRPGAPGACRRLYDEVERPLVRVLAKMEDAGVRVDVDLLRRLASELASEARRLEEEIQDLAGTQFVVNSTPQLREILFNKLGLTPQKRTKTGYSTDAQTLEKLRGEHPIIDALLRYREVEKLRSTYGESLLAEVAPDGRIHATFNQTVARTGRLSSDQPNLHNIPVRSEEGRRFRSCFLPAEGCRFLVADYNQIELRVIAHLAEDPGLIDAFRTGHRHPQRHRVAHLRGRCRGRDHRHAVQGQDGVLRAGLRDGVVRAGAAARRSRSRRRPAILKAYFEGFPNVRGLHGPGRGRGPRPRLHRDPLRPAAAHPRAAVGPLPGPGRRRAPGHERRHPGPGRRHLQGGAGPPGRPARRRGTGRRRLGRAGSARIGGRPGPDRGPAFPA